MLRTSRHVMVLASPALACGLLITVAAPTFGQTKVVSVEEHWELKLGQPDYERSAPQTTMVISPNGHVDGDHFLFTLNHVSAPNYQPGGMQVQFWDGAQLVDSVSCDSGVFSHEDEVVRWTQRISLDDDQLKFQVVDGESETWGSFGGDELSIDNPTSLSSLNSYRPGVSLAESQVSYAENRVASLTLTKIVWVTDDGEVHEMNAPIPLDTSLDP